MTIERLALGAVIVAGLVMAAAGMALMVYVAWQSWSVVVAQ